MQNFGMPIMNIDKNVLSFCEKKKRRDTDEKEMLFDIWDDGATTEGFPFHDYTTYKSEIKMKDEING